MTKQEAELIIKTENKIHELELEYNKFIQTNMLPDNFHNVFVWLVKKGVIILDD